MTTEAKPAASPDDLLKAAVAGKPAPDTPTTGTKALRSLRAPPWLRRNARVLGSAGAALVLGAAVGAGAMAVAPSRGRAPDAALAAIRADLEADRTATGRLVGEIANLQQTLTDLRGIGETARKEAAARGTALTERLAQVDRAVATKFAALGERIEQAEREQTARITNLAQAERRAATAPAAKPEPAQTGSLADPKATDPKSADPKSTDLKAAEPKAAEAKPAPRAKPVADDKPPVIDGWAVRDVYDGVAIVESRNRRLAQVVPGDMLPGVGRVEAVERQGRNWVVVTRQGIVTHQPW